jgi:sulfite exporter TauE/SafE
VPTALLLTALLMGVAGGPHCATMCGAGCGALCRDARAMGLFQLGRLAGYTAAGAAAGGAVQSVAWLSQQTAALRPLWTLMHLVVLAWGLTLLVLARQPAVVERTGRALWTRTTALRARGPHAPLLAGLLWTLMPCGLLYSALVLASLSGGPLAGALVMAAFAASSGLALGLAPALLRWLRTRGDALGGTLGTRGAGAVLALTAVASLGAGALHRVALWCGLV